MGLDNFFEKSCSEGETAPVVQMEREPSLCGGIFSGHGRGSFRGKVYAGIVEEITGVTLYDDIIPPDTLVEMGGKIDEHLEQNADPVFQSDGYDVKRQDLADLAMCFKAYGAAGYRLASWY